MGLEEDARRAAAESARRQTQEQRARDEGRRARQQREEKALTDAARQALESWKATMKRDVANVRLAYHPEAQEPTIGDWLTTPTVPAHLSGGFTCDGISLNVSYGYNRWTSHDKGLIVTLEGIEHIPISSMAALGRALAERDQQRISSAQANRTQRKQHVKKRLTNTFAYGCAMLVATTIVILVVTTFINRP